MKRLFLLAAVTFIVACNSLSTTDVKIVVPQRQGWDNEIPLYGDVESVTISEYGVDVRTASYNSVAYCFNTAGDVVEFESICYQEQWLNSKCTYMYDSLGNLIERNDYSSDGSLREKSTYEYDSLGNVLGQEIYWAGVTLGISINTTHLGTRLRMPYITLTVL